MPAPKPSKKSTSASSSAAYFMPTITRSHSGPGRVQPAHAVMQHVPSLKHRGRGCYLQWGGYFVPITHRLSSPGTVVRPPMSLDSKVLYKSDICFICQNHYHNLCSDPQSTVTTYDKSYQVKYRVKLVLLVTSIKHSACIRQRDSLTGIILHI